MKADAHTYGDSRPLCHLLACFLSLGTLIIFARLLILGLNSSLAPFIALAAYQDVVMVALVVWGYFSLLRMVERPAARRLMIAGGWALCVVLTILTVIAETIYLLIRSPLTYRLVVVSQNMAGIGGSIAQGTRLAVVAIPLALLFVISFTELLWRMAPAAFAAMLPNVCSPVFLVVVGVYGLIGHAWAVRNVTYPPMVMNAEWAFVSSLFEKPRPMVTERIPPEYLTDFQPTTHKIDAAAALAKFDILNGRGQHHPLNVLMIVMESVGSRRLHLYGAAYADTPELDALSRNAIVFDRIYSAQANTSAAIAALFCSVYPYHGWFPVSRYAPELTITGLPAILKQNNYRTAFIHSGQLYYDNNYSFLKDHGFTDIEDEPRTSTPRATRSYLARQSSGSPPTLRSRSFSPCGLRTHINRICPP